MIIGTVQILSHWFGSVVSRVWLCQCTLCACYACVSIRTCVPVCVSLHVCAHTCAQVSVLWRYTRTHVCCWFCTHAIHEIQLWNGKTTITYIQPLLNSSLVIKFSRSVKMTSKYVIFLGCNTYEPSRLSSNLYRPVYDRQRGVRLCYRRLGSRVLTLVLRVRFGVGSSYNKYPMLYFICSYFNPWSQKVTRFQAVTSSNKEHHLWQCHSPSPLARSELAK